MISGYDYRKDINFSTGAVTEFSLAPMRCTLKDVVGVVSADPGDAQTITITTGATVATATTALGVLTFGTDIAAGATGVWTKNSTTGNTVIEKGHFIKCVTSAGAAAKAELILSLDEGASVPGASR